MKTVKRIFSVSLAFALVLSSCTIKKRHYMPGYHIEWKSSTQTSAQPSSEIQQEKTTVIPETKKTELPNTVNADQSLSASTNTSPDQSPDISLSEYTESLKKQPSSKYATKDISTSTVKKHGWKRKPALTNGDDGGAKKGLVMILVGLLLFLLGYLFFILFLNAFGLLFWYIFAVAGCILIVIGIIVLILGLI
ncbi:MAG: hypothetical protein ACHQF2_05035 [Flavobacteriales bacterium]